MIPMCCAAWCAGWAHDPGSRVNEGLAGLRRDGHAQRLCGAFGSDRNGAPWRSLLRSSVCVPGPSRRSDQSDLVGWPRGVFVLETPGTWPVCLARDTSREGDCVFGATGHAAGRN